MKRERALTFCSATLMLALLVSVGAVCLLVKAHYRQGQQLVHHHSGWAATYEELVSKHAELNEHRQIIAEKEEQLSMKQAQLAGASEQLQLFHSALQHKEATLAQLLQERAALQDSVRTLTARAKADMDAARHSGGGHMDAMAAQLAASTREVESLTSSLERCFTDLTAAVSMAQAQAYQGDDRHAQQELSNEWR